MSKKVTLKAGLSEKATNREKEQDEKVQYLGNVTDKVLDAVEDIFGETTPPPTGNDMIDVLALTSVSTFARQIYMSCRSKETMKSVMKSTMWALTNQIIAYAAPFMEQEEPWDDIAGEEGGKDGRTES